MYWVQQDGAEFLITHPKPNSMVVNSASKMLRLYSAPNDREGKKIEVAGRKFYSTGALGIKAMLYMACISRYFYVLWEQFLEIMDKGQVSAEVGQASWQTTVDISQACP